MADQFDAFQKEVEEDLQRERMQKLWKDYGTFIIAGCAAIVLAVAGYKFVEARRIAAAEATSQAFSESVKALSATKDAVDTKPLMAVASGTSSYGMLAKLRLAAAQAAAGETAKAVAAYDALAAQPGVDRQLADYARLQSAMLTVDTASWTDVQNRVNDLAVDSSPWRHAAREILGLAAYKAGKSDEAKAQLSKLVSDPATPRSIAERVAIVMGEIAQGELAKTVPAAVVPPGDAKPVETKPADTKPADTKPAETKPGAVEAPGKKKK